MNDYWHIPRASLSPSSASSAVSSASSTQRSNRSAAHTKHKLTPTHYRHQQQLPQRNPHSHSLSMMQENTAATTSAGRTGTRRDSEMSATATAVAVMATSKRGSRSSQGSNDSNNSTRSAASGSLLLTAANLERMTEIHRKQHQQQQQQQHHQHQKPHHKLQHLNQHLPLSASHAASSPSIYNANLVHATQSGNRQYYNGHGGVKAITAAAHHDQTDSIINIDPNLNFIKTKDMDTVSIASSMHFTMVNGETGAQKKTKKGLCDRGRQVTVLIISMSTIFLVLIMGMVYALEMRAREMPQS